MKTDNAVGYLSVMEYIYDSIENMDGRNDDVFRQIALLAMEITEGNSCLVALIDEADNRYSFKIIVPPSAEHPENGTSALSENLLRRVIATGEAVLAGPDAALSNSIICAPLMIRSTVFGVLSLTGKKYGRSFGQSDLKYIRTLTKRASLNMENRLLYESMYSNITNTFRSLVTSIHLRDHYTERHSSNVTELAAKTAEALRCSKKEIESVRIAGMLHDIGKIAIPDNILLKKDRLTEEEYATIKEHPVIGEYILKSVALMDSERKIILHHHERWDGKGYPDRLSGNDIPLLSRILSVADSFDAMMSDRPYRDALGIDIAIDELKKNSESQFDKNVVGTFISAYCGSC